MFYGRIHGFGFSVSLSLSLTSLGWRGARAGASRCRLPTSISKIVEWWKETRLCIPLRDERQRRAVAGFPRWANPVRSRRLAVGLGVADAPRLAWCTGGGDPASIALDI